MDIEGNARAKSRVPDPGGIRDSKADTMDHYIPDSIVHTKATLLHFSEVCTVGKPTTFKSKTKQ